MRGRSRFPTRVLMLMVDISCLCASTLITKIPYTHRSRIAFIPWIRQESLWPMGRRVPGSNDKGRFYSIPMLSFHRSGVVSSSRGGHQGRKLLPPHARFQRDASQKGCVWVSEKTIRFCATIWPHCPSLQLRSFSEELQLMPFKICTSFLRLKHAD